MHRQPRHFFAGNGEGIQDQHAPPGDKGHEWYLCQRLEPADALHGPVCCVRDPGRVHCGQCRIGNGCRIIKDWFVRGWNVGGRFGAHLIGKLGELGRLYRWRERHLVDPLLDRFGVNTGRDVDAVGADCLDGERITDHERTAQRFGVTGRTQAPVSRQPDQTGYNGTNHRQIFVDRQFNQHIVILWLTAAPDTLLGQPVTERADQPGNDARRVGEDGRVEEGKQAVERGGAGDPHCRIPAQSGDDRHQDKWYLGHDAGLDGHIGCRVHVELIPRREHRESAEPGQQQRTHHDQHVEGRIFFHLGEERRPEAQHQQQHNGNNGHCPGGHDDPIVEAACVCRRLRYIFTAFFQIQQHDPNRRADAND